MADDDRITKLEAQIEKLEGKQDDLYRQLAEARLDQWKGRLEDLEVQAKLGAMETNDRVSALVQQARDRWNDAKTQLTGATATAGDALEPLRDGLENAMSELRKALMEAKSRAKS